MNVLNIANKNLFGMPRVRLLNTIFHLRKIYRKTCWIHKKPFFLFFYKFEQHFHFFLFYDAEMHTKLWLKAPSSAGALGQTLKKF